MSENVFKHAFFENKITDITQAKVSVMTNALQYGTGLFGGIRGYYNPESNSLDIFRIEDHYNRFLSSIKILGCKFPYTRNQLIDITLELIAKNKPQCNCYFRPFAYVGSTNLGPNFANVTMDFTLYMIPLEEYLPVHKGLSVMISAWRRVGDNSIPSRGKFSGSYINSALARADAQNNGFDEAILLSESGHVSEGSAENIFIVRDGAIITPSSADDILEGITRRTLMKLSQDIGISVVERTIDRSELYIADEIFLSGTGCQLAWVRAVDNRTIGDGTIGPLSKRLQDLYFKVVHNQDNRYSSWCTRVSLS